MTEVERAVYKRGIDKGRREADMKYGKLRGLFIKHLAAKDNVPGIINEDNLRLGLHKTFWPFSGNLFDRVMEKFDEAVKELLKGAKKIDRRKLTEQDCLAIGGHCWNIHSANDVVNEFGESEGTRHLMYYPNGEPQYRTCKHCGKREEYTGGWG